MSLSIFWLLFMSLCSQSNEIYLDTSFHQLGPLGRVGLVVTNSVCGKIVYRGTQINAIALQKVTLNWANMKNWTNLNFAMLAIVLKSVVTVR